MGYKNRLGNIAPRMQQFLTLYRGSKFPRKFGMGVPYFLGCQIVWIGPVGACGMVHGFNQSKCTTNRCLDLEPLIRFIR